MRKKLKLFIGTTIILFVMIFFIVAANKKLISTDKTKHLSDDNFNVEPINSNDSTFQNNTSSPNYTLDEKYTNLNYYYLTITDSSYSPWDSSLPNYDYNNILRTITYVRYDYSDNQWILAKNNNNSPFFSQTGNGIIIDHEHYYIPIYELQEGKNKIVVVETTNNGSKKEKEFIINRAASEYDNIYSIKNVPQSDSLELTTYQDTININLNDYNNILLTGSFYSKYNIIDISWIRFEQEPSTLEWESIPKSRKDNPYYQNEGKATILGNHWAIDILGLNSNRNKIYITLSDSSGAKIRKTIFINNTSAKPINHNNKYELHIINDNGTKFINNEIMIWFNSNLGYNKCKEIIDEIGGEIASGTMSFMDFYVVELNYEFVTREEIYQYCEELSKKYDEIELISLNPISEDVPD